MSPERLQYQSLGCSRWNPSAGFNKRSFVAFDFIVNVLYLYSAPDVMTTQSLKLQILSFTCGGGT